MTRTKVFIDGHVFDRGFEGVASYIAGLYRSLMENYPDHYQLIIASQNVERTRVHFPPNANILHVPYRRKNAYVRLMFEIPKIIRETSSQWAHFQYFTPPVKSCRWLVTIHDLLFYDFPKDFPLGYRLIRKVLFPISAWRSDALLTVSKYSKQRISQWFKVNSDRVLITPNGAPAHHEIASADSALKQGEIPNGRQKYFLCVSRFEPRKNQTLLLRTYLKHEFWRRGIGLIFVGNRSIPVPDFAEVLSQAPAEARGLVEVRSGISAEDLANLYANALATVYPSRAEGFGIPPLESIAHGTAVICASNTAMTDFDFLAPLFFKTDSEDELGRLMELTYAEPDVRRDQVKRAQAEIARRYTWAAAAEVLHNAIQSRGSAAS